MKKIILTTAALCVLAITTTKAQERRQDVKMPGNRPSTQRIGESGSNGSGEAVVTHVYNGTGDGLKTSGMTTYSQQLEAKGLLPSKAGEHASHHEMAPQPAAEGAPAEGHNGATAPAAKEPAKH